MKFRLRIIYFLVLVLGISIHMRLGFTSGAQRDLRFYQLMMLSNQWSMIAAINANTRKSDQQTEAINRVTKETDDTGHCLETFGGLLLTMASNQAQKAFTIEVLPIPPGAFTNLFRTNQPVNTKETVL